MENVLQYLQEHLPTIVNYLLTVLGYTLYFIVQAKVTKSDRSLKVLFKDRVQHVDETANNLEIAETQLRADFEKELTAAKEAYIAATKRCQELEKRLEKAEQTMLLYIEEVHDELSNN